MVVIGIENTHDSGATAIIDGKIVYSVNEERLNRVKGFGGFPYKSLEAILKKIGNVKIDAIALDGITKLGSPGDFERPDRLRIFREGAAILGIDKMLTYSNYRVETLFSILKIILPNKINIELNEFNLGATKVIREDHHTCHAASAFYASGWDECLVLTMDGSGDGYSSRVFVAENRKLKLVHSIPMVHSLCANYSYATSVLGFKTNRHEGKLLGLAAYTETNKECLRIFQDRISYDKNIMSFSSQYLINFLCASTSSSNFLIISN